MVLDLLADGCSNADIGEHLGLDHAVVRAHVGGLLAMLGMQRHVAATVEPTHRALP